MTNQSERLSFDIEWKEYNRNSWTCVNLGISISELFSWYESLFKVKITYPYWEIGFHCQKEGSS